MKKIVKSKLFWIIAIIVIVVVAFIIRSGGSSQAVYVTEPVKIGTVVQTVTATGQVKSASEIELNFKNTGTLGVLKVDTGDKVKAGQVLAQLKANDLLINISKARANLDEAQANLNRVKAGSTKEDIAVSEASVEKYKSDLAAAQNDLTSAESTYKQAYENEKQNALVDANSAITKANISLQEAYDIIYFEGDAKNLSTGSTALQNEVEFERGDSLSKVDAASLAYNVAKLDPQDQKVNSAISVTLTALTAVQETLDDLADVLDKAILTSILTQTELDTLKATNNTERAITAASSSTVQGAKNDLDSARITYQTKVDSAKDAIDAAQKNLLKAQADLTLKQAPARPEDIALYEARYKQSLADLQLAQDRYEDTILRSPIDGVIVETNFKVGEQTSLSEPVIKMLSVQNYEIDVDIPEADITKVNLGGRVEVTLDAFTSEDIFWGAVTKIDPAQTEIQDVVYYKVTVGLETQQPENVAAILEKIKSGMTANITIQTGKKENVLVVPSRAVKDNNGGKKVLVLENNKTKDVPVTVGLRGDDGLIEVISGLSEGELVVVSTRTTK